jgi:hypothetical protein
MLLSEPKSVDGFNFHEPKHQEKFALRKEIAC